MKQLLLALVMFLTQFSQAQWEPDVRLTNNPDTSLTSFSMQRCIASNGDTVHATWCDSRPGSGNWEIYYKRSTYGGLTWGEDIRLTDDPAKSRRSSIAVSDLTVHVAWMDNRDGNYEIYYKRSTDGGNNWDDDVRLTDNDSWSQLPSVSSSGSWVHVVWSEIDQLSGVTEVYHKYSIDGGLTWETGTSLSEPSTDAYNASVASLGSYVYVVWNDTRDGGNTEIYFRRSTDGGSSWEEEIRLTYNLAISQWPSISLNGSFVHIVWADARNGNYEIYYKRSIDWGENWDPDTRLSYGGQPVNPNISSEGSVVNVVWQDNRSVYGNWEIYYKRSTHWGENWEPDTALTTFYGNALRPFVSISGSVTHVIWCDDRNMNPEIYYKRNPTGGLPVGTYNDYSASFGNKVSIYPNPASSIIHIQITDHPNAQLHLTIRNILGEVLITQSIRMGEAVVDISLLPNGIYFLSASSGNYQLGMAKFIIKRD